MSDLLSAASLLLAALGIMYGFWYGELSDAKETKIPDHPRNCIVPRKKVTRVIYSKALPLTLTSLLLALVFLPDAVKLSLDSFTMYRQNGFGFSFKTYDAVSTAFCLVVALSVTLAAHLTFVLFELAHLRNALRRKEKASE